MNKFPRLFEVYDVTIEFHAGGRRDYPPSFKRGIKEKVDSTGLTVGQVVKRCNAPHPLINKWRAGVNVCKRCICPPNFEGFRHHRPKPILAARQYGNRNLCNSGRYLTFQSRHRGVFLPILVVGLLVL